MSLTELEDTAMPRLAVHAGLPKCATSSLQRLFVTNDFEVAKALDVIWIGRDFTPGGVGTPVSEFMYNKEKTIERIRSVPLEEDKTYLLSSEALCGMPDVLDILRERFDLSDVVLSVRLPVMMALSNYCFSGWLTRPPHKANLSGAQDRFSAILKRLSQNSDIKLCPVEAPQLGERFCRDLLGRTPEDADAVLVGGGSVNRSISPALAVAMHKALTDHDIRDIAGPHRIHYTRVAAQHRGRPEFYDLMPEVFMSVFRNRALCDTAIESYAATLDKYGVASDVITACVSACKSRFEKIRTLKTTDEALEKALWYRANWNVAHVQREHPDVLPLSQVDLSRYHRPMIDVLGEEV